MNMAFRNILITGGAGFVGSNVAIHLKRNIPDSHITCLDNLKRQGVEMNVPRLREAGIVFVHGDIRCPEDLEINNIDLVIECSAEPSVLAGFDSPLFMVRTNLDGAINCLELCRKTGAAFFFISTSRVYPVTHLLNLRFQESETRLELSPEQDLCGVSSKGISEDFPMDGVRSLYGATKYAAELLTAEYGSAFGVPYLINRCGILTGPWQMGKVDQGLVALWLIRHHFKKPLEYIGFGGTGKQVRDFLDIADFSELLLLELDNFESLKNQTFNVGGGPSRCVSLLELTRMAQQATGNEIEIQPVPKVRAGDIPYFVTDMSRLAAVLDWKPALTPEQTIHRIAQWIRENENHVRNLL